MIEKAPSTIYRIPTSYTARQLVEAHRHATAHPEARYLPSAPGEDHEVLTATAWLQWFRARLMEKIEAHDPTTPDPFWRKVQPEWQRDARRTADQVNTPRLIVRWVPRDLRERLKHRIAEEE